MRTTIDVLAPCRKVMAINITITSSVKVNSTITNIEIAPT